MEPFNELREVDRTFLGKFIESRTIMNEPEPVSIQCNDINKLAETILELTKTKTLEVYILKHPFFSGGLDTRNRNKLKEIFTDFCNFFEKHKLPLISIIQKNLVNYSGGKESIYISDFPKEKKYILIVENLNLWDKNSQYHFLQIADKHPNMILIMQIRSDYDFAENHFDNEWRGSGFKFKLK